MTDSKNKPVGQGERPVLDNDPLMELARLSGAGGGLLNDDQAYNSSIRSAPNYAADLERELADELGFNFSLNEDEKTGDTVSVTDASDDYSDFLTTEPPSFLRQSQQPVEPVFEAVDTPSLSLEDELENLLFQDERTVPSIEDTPVYPIHNEYVEAPSAPYEAEQVEPEIVFEDEFAVELDAAHENVPSVEAPLPQADADFNADAMTDAELDLSDFEFQDFDLSVAESENASIEFSPHVYEEPKPQNLQFSDEDYAVGLSDALMDELTFDMEDELTSTPTVQAEPAPRKDFVPSRLEGLTENYQAPVFKNPTATSFPFFKPAAKPETVEAVVPPAADHAASAHLLAEEPVFQDTTDGYIDPLDFRLNELTFGHDDFATAPSGDVGGYGAIESENFDNYGDGEHPFDMDAHIARELATQASFEWQANHQTAISGAGTSSELQGENTSFDESNFDFSLDEDDLASNTASAYNEEYSDAANSYADNHENIHAAEDVPDFLNQYATYAAPEVETVNIGDAVVEQTHSLQLPEVVYEDEKEVSSLNDLETEFSEVFNAIEVEQQKDTTTPLAADQAFDDIFSEDFAQYAAAGSVAGAAIAGVAASHARPQGDKLALEEDFFNHWAADEASHSVPQNVLDSIKQQKAAEVAYPSALDLGAATAAYQERPVRGRRAMLMATVAGVFVLIGGVAYHFIGGGTEANEPVVITADSQPIKVQPENPGGETVPNQDKAVYGRVDGTIPQTPQQPALLSDQDEPVDLPAEDDGFPDEQLSLEDTISGGNDHAVAEESTPPPLVAPRQVQTMIVRPDGSIVASNTVADEPSVQPTAPQQPSILQIPAQRPQPVTNAPVAPTTAPIIAPPAEEQAPVVMQPVAPAAPVQPPVAATPPAPIAPIAAGTYMIQVASQPSEDLAQKSMASVKQKFGSVLGNRAVEIRKADIPGKGTYYRVRVAGGTKAEANTLCERFKAAGGSCFVTL